MNWIRNYLARRAWNRASLRRRLIASHIMRVSP